MDRYNRITNKNQREIVLLKAWPCSWGKCRFCDYTEDNSTDKEEILNSIDQALAGNLLAKKVREYNLKISELGELSKATIEKNIRQYEEMK